jgi:hypothetical protein
VAYSRLRLVRLGGEYFLFCASAARDIGDTRSHLVWQEKFSPLVTPSTSSYAFNFCYEIRTRLEKHDFGNYRLPLSLCNS